VTRERAEELLPVITAFAEGKEIEYKDSLGCWMITATPQWDDLIQYRIKSEPKMRPMTRGEVLYMITTTPAMITRLDMGRTNPAMQFGYDTLLSNYEYAIIDKTGEPIDGWHKFEVEDDK